MTTKNLMVVVELIQYNNRGKKKETELFVHLTVPKLYLMVLNSAPEVVLGGHQLNRTSCFTLMHHLPKA